MPSTPPDIGQPTRGARTAREDRAQRGNKWWTLVAVCMGTFMLLLDVTIVNVALPDIQQALNSSFSDLQWIVDAYALTLAAFLLTAQSTGFVRNLEGKVVVSLYSSGAIGRLVPDNVAGLVRYIRGHTAASA